MDPALQEALRHGGDDVFAAIVRLDPDEPLPPTVRVVARFGDIATVRMRRGDVAEAHEDDAVASLKAVRYLLPEPALEDDAGDDAWDPDVPGEDGDSAATGALAMRATDVRRNEAWGTGQGVVVAVLDWGLDFTHPEFRHPDGTTRLIALWDQGARYDPAFPNAYGYGRIHRRNEIDRALATGAPFVALGYDPRTADRGSGTHGTHVTAIAAGNGRAGGPRGMAPGADLMFVHLATSSGTTGRVPLTDSAAVLEALHCVDAEAGARAACINMSLGTHGGPHDGSSLVEQGIDAFVARAPRRIVVQSTGNYFARRVHAAGRLAAGGVATLPMLIDGDDTTANDLEVWYPGCDALHVRLRAPDGREVCAVALGEQRVVVDGDVEIGRLYHRRGDPNNHDHQVQLRLDAPAATGRWTLVLEAVRVADGRFDAWIERDARCAPCQPSFAPDRAVEQGTTGSICNGRRTLVVGAFDGRDPAHPLARFSSSGPTRDGRRKPDLLAPGVRVLSARSAPRRGRGEPELLSRMSGTSMSAPHVTGAAALLCEAAPRALTCEDVRALLCSTARVDPDASAVDRLRMGAGRLDVAAALSALSTAPPLTTPLPEIAMESSNTPGCACAGAHVPAEALPTPPAAETLPTRCETCGASTSQAAPVENERATDDRGHGPDEADDADEADEADGRRRRRVYTRGPSIMPVIGLPYGGIGAAVVAPMGGVSIALPIGMPAPATAATATAAPTSAPAGCPPCDAGGGGPVAVASDEPAVPAMAGEFWQVREADAAQAEGTAFAEDAGEAEWPTDDADAWHPSPDETDLAGWHASEYDEIADRVVESAPWHDAAQFVVDLLARAGVTSSEQDDASAPLASAALPARLFDHYTGRRHLLPDALAQRFDAVAMPGGPLPPLAAGDWLLRRGEGGLGHVSVLAAPRVWPAHALRANGFTLEQGRGGGFVHVIEPGHAPARREDLRARRICDASRRVPGDTLVLRARRAESFDEYADESVDARWVQGALNRVLGTDLAVDGVAGAQTRAAIRAFQGQRGLAVDGIVGPRTEAALRQAADGGGRPPAPASGLGGLIAAALAPRPGTGTDCTTLDAFDQGRDTLQPAHQMLLVGIARRIQRERIRVAIVTGFASVEGDDPNNLLLGQRRADSTVRGLRETLERTLPGSSRGVTMPTFSRGENDQIPGSDAARNRRVTVCLQPRPVAPPTPPAPVPRTKVFSVTAKSFIARIGGNRGSLDCGIEIGPVTIPGASNAGLLALAVATDAAFSENPADDRVFRSPPPENKGYRLLSQGELRAMHNGTQLVNVSVPAGLRLDAGKECVPGTGACLSAPPLIIDQAFATRRLDASRIAFRWGVKGRPPLRAELAFNAICHRDSVYIWHEVIGTVDASSGTPVITQLVVQGSRFPSHRIWLDGAERHHVRQGPLSNLWDGTSADPTRVR